MKKTFTTLIGSSILAASFTLLWAPANAGTFKSCTTNDYDIAGKITGTSRCTISKTESQDFLNRNPMTVNEEEGFFDKTNWEFGGKIGNNTGFNGDGSGKSGEWDISSVIQDDWKDVMLVFKSGKGTTLVGYEVEDGVTSGNWNSPFIENAFDFKGNTSVKDVSHISVYYSPTDNSPPPKQEVPEPASLFGLGVVGGAMVLSRRRRQHQHLSSNFGF